MTPGKEVETLVKMSERASMRVRVITVLQLIEEMEKRNEVACSVETCFSEGQCNMADSGVRAEADAGLLGFEAEPTCGG